MEVYLSLRSKFPELDWIVVETFSGAIEYFVYADASLPIKCVTDSRMWLEGVNAYSDIGGVKAWVLNRRHDIGKLLANIGQGSHLYMYDPENDIDISMHNLPRGLVDYTLSMFMEKNDAIIAGSFATFCAKNVLGLPQTWVPTDIDVFVDATEPGTVDNLPGKTLDMSFTGLYDIVLGQVEHSFYSKVIYTNEIENNGTSPTNIVQFVTFENHNGTGGSSFEDVVSRSMDFTVAASTIAVHEYGNLILTIRHAEDIKNSVLRMQDDPDLYTRKSRVAKWQEKGFLGDIHEERFRQEGSRLSIWGCDLKERFVFGMRDCKLYVTDPKILYKVYGCTNVNIICNVHARVKIENSTVLVTGFGNGEFKIYGSRVKFFTERSCDILDYAERSGWLKTISDPKVEIFDREGDVECSESCVPVVRPDPRLPLQNALVRHCEQALMSAKLARDLAFFELVSNNS
jgi:hypothetical protein